MTTARVLARRRSLGRRYRRQVLVGSSEPGCLLPRKVRVCVGLPSGGGHEPLGFEPRVFDDGAGLFLGEPEDLFHVGAEVGEGRSLSVARSSLHGGGRIVVGCLGFLVVDPAVSDEIGLPRPHEEERDPERADSDTRPGCGRSEGRTGGGADAESDKKGGCLGWFAHESPSCGAGLGFRLQHG